MRVYQLASTPAFEARSSSSCSARTRRCSKTDLVKKDEYILSPGQTKTTTLMPTDQVTALGIFAAYRNFQARQMARHRADPRPQDHHRQVASRRKTAWLRREPAPAKGRALTMGWENKVVWTEGLFLQPQHLQQQERYVERLVRASTGGLRPYSLGPDTA